MWRDEIVEKSWQLLVELRDMADFILIGGRYGRPVRLQALFPFELRLTLL